MFCSLNLQLPHGATVVGAYNREESVGWLFPWLFYFFPSPCQGTTKHVFLFSKGIWNFFIDYLLPKIHLPSAIILDWASCVRELQNKGLSFILLKGQPSQPKFSFRWSHRHHWNSPWLSHQAVHTFKVASLFWVHLFQNAGGWVTIHIGNVLVKVKGCIEFTETDIGCMMWGRGQESFLPHVHIQLMQHHFPTVQHLGCHKSGDSTCWSSSGLFGLSS